MSILMYTPVNESMPMQLDLDFDLEDLDFRTLSTEAPPAESLEPSLSVGDDLSPSLTLAGSDMWNELSSDSRSTSSSPVPRSVLDYLNDVEREEPMIKSEIEEDLYSWASSPLDSNVIRNDCMWSSGESADPPAPKTVEKSDASPAAAVCAAAKGSAPAVVKCEPAVVVKCEPEDAEDAVVAVSCGPVVTAVASAVGGVASGTCVRTGARVQASLGSKSEVSLLKSNNRSLLISSRTGAVSASATSATPVASSPSKHCANSERVVSERVKVQPSVMWGPWSGSAFASMQRPLESDGDSPRPYTPPSQSESEGDEDEHPRFKHSLDMVLGLNSSLFDACDVDSSSSASSTNSLDSVSMFNCDLDFVDDEDDDEYVAALAEQLCRPSATAHATEGARGKSNNRKCDSTSTRDDIESSRFAFMSDHSYHLSKGAVKTEHLGVQTPSDSGEDDALDERAHATLSAVINALWEEVPQEAAVRPRAGGRPRGRGRGRTAGRGRRSKFGGRSPDRTCPSAVSHEPAAADESIYYVVARDDSLSDEEEIDVVSVGDKQSSRSSSSSSASATALPTNPSARDRQQLQRTVASAITAKHHQRAGAGEAAPRGRIPVRFTLGDRTVGVRTVTQAVVSDAAYDGASASSEDLWSPTRAGPGRKRGGGAGRGCAKRPRVQYQHRVHHHAPRGRGRRPRGDDSEPDPTEKRSLHNDMERQRRIDLRNLVDDLRKLVPDLKDNKRAAKVMILREAAKYCRTLADKEVGLRHEAQALRVQQNRMMRHLSGLRRDLAACRSSAAGSQQQ